MIYKSVCLNLLFFAIAQKTFAEEFGCAAVKSLYKDNGCCQDTSGTVTTECKTLDEMSMNVNFLNDFASVNRVVMQVNDDVTHRFRMESWDEKTFTEALNGKMYHHVVIGAGSAGGAAAHELAMSTSKQNVLLIERGELRTKFSRMRVNVDDPLMTMEEEGAPQTNNNFVGNRGLVTSQAQRRLIFTDFSSGPLSYSAGTFCVTDSTNGNVCFAEPSETGFVFDETDSYVHATNTTFKIKFDWSSSHSDILLTTDFGSPITHGDVKLLQYATASPMYPQLSMGAYISPEDHSMWDPMVLGGGSSINAGISWTAPEWWVEMISAKSGVPFDFDTVKTLAQKVTDLHVRTGEENIESSELNAYFTKRFRDAKTYGMWPADAAANNSAVYDEYKPIITGTTSYGMSIPEGGGGAIKGAQYWDMAPGTYNSQGTAALIEQYVNEKRNLNLLVNTAVEKIVYDDTTKTPVKIIAHRGGFSSDSYATQLEERQPMEILLAPNAKIYLAGNVYNTPTVLERSGVGVPKYVAKTGTPLVAENNHVGENFKNNAIARGVIPHSYKTLPAWVPNDDVAPMRKAQISSPGRNAPYEWGVASAPCIGSSTFDYDKRCSTRFQEADFALWQDRSSYELEWVDGRFPGTVHSSGPWPQANPDVSFAWFNLEPKENNRNAQGLHCALQKLYHWNTGRAGHASSYKREGTYDLPVQSGLEWMSTDLEVDPVTKVYLAWTSFWANPYGKPVSNTTSDERFKVAVDKIFDSIHWVGSTQLGLAVDENFAVKGVENTFVVDTSWHSIQHPVNNWLLTAQLARYVVKHTLGQTSMQSLSSAKTTLLVGVHTVGVHSLTMSHSEGRYFHIKYKNTERLGDIEIATEVYFVREKSTGQIIFRRTAANGGNTVKSEDVMTYIDGIATLVTTSIKIEFTHKDGVMTLTDLHVGCVMEDESANFLDDYTHDGVVFHSKEIVM